MSVHEYTGDARDYRLVTRFDGFDELYADSGDPVTARLTDGNGALLRRFATVIARAVTHAAKLSDIDTDDLRSFAAERVLMYGRGEAWTASPRLTAAAPPSMDRNVQRTLNFDLIDYMRNDMRERGGPDTVSLDAMTEAGAVAASLTYTMPEPDDADDIRALAANDAVTAYLDANYPALMHYLDGGMTRAGIAHDARMTKGKAQYMLERERAAFMADVENGTLDAVRRGEDVTACVTSAPLAA
jgi:hypothetical protein